MPPLRPLRVALLALAGVLWAAGPAAAATIDGSPLNIDVGTTGRLSASFDGAPSRLFAPPGSSDGDAGLTLAFPSQDNPVVDGVVVPFGSFIAGTQTTTP